MPESLRVLATPAENPSTGGVTAAENTTFNSSLHMYSHSHTPVRHPFKGNFSLF